MYIIWMNKKIILKMWLLGGGRGKGKKINQSQKISNSSNNNEANNKNEDKTEDNIKINPIKEIDDLVSKIIKGKKKLKFKNNEAFYNLYLLNNIFNFALRNNLTKMKK